VERTEEDQSKESPIILPDLVVPQAELRLPNPTPIVKKQTILVEPEYGEEEESDIERADLGQLLEVDSMSDEIDRGVIE